MVFGIFMTTLGLGAICALLYYCTIFALPVFVGLSAALWALNTGAGTGSALVGFMIGMIVFVMGQYVFSHSRSLAVRWIIALLFAVPATIAGYSLVVQLSELGVPSFFWQHTLAVIGATIICCTVIAQFGKSSGKIAPL